MDICQAEPQVTTFFFLSITVKYWKFHIVQSNACTQDQVSRNIKRNPTEMSKRDIFLPLTF